MDFCSSSSENLTSPVPGRIHNFTRPVYGFPSINIYIICECLKKEKQRPDRNGQPGGKFADPVTFFSRKPSKNIDANGSVAEGC